jgi:tetratricopeptide (TPR) repeat protein
METSINEEKNQLLNTAYVLAEMGDWERAIVDYKKILAIDPDDVDAHHALGDIYLKHSLFQLAYESYDKAALIFLSRGETNKAVSIFKLITAMDSSQLPEGTQAQINYAHGYIKIDQVLKADEIEPAIELIGKILKFRPQDPMVQSQLKTLEDKIDQMPVSIQTYQMLGNAFFKNNLFEKARQMFMKITEIEPQNLDARQHLAQAYLKQGATSEAKKEFLNLAEEAYAKGYIDQAFDLAQKAIELKSVEARYISGLIYFKQEKFEEAVVEFETLLRFKVNHLGALIYLGKALDMLGRLEKARSTFQKALEIDNESPEVQEAWIEFCVRAKEIDNAIPNMTAILEKAVTGNNAEMVVKYAKLMIRLEPDNASTHRKLIDSLETLGDHPGTAEALYRYALLLERKKLFNDATECLEKALVLSPNNAQVIEKTLARLGKTEIKTKYGSATETENPIVFKNSDFWEGSDPLSSAFTEELSEHKDIDSIDDPLKLAGVCAQKGFLKAAIEIYQQILETNPGSAEARKHLAEVSALYLKKLTGSK